MAVHQLRHALAQRAGRVSPVTPIRLHFVGAILLGVLATLPFVFAHPLHQLPHGTVLPLWVPYGFPQQVTYACLYGLVGCTGLVIIYLLLVTSSMKPSRRDAARLRCSEEQLGMAHLTELHGRGAAGELASSLPVVGELASLPVVGGARCTSDESLPCSPSMASTSASSVAGPGSKLRVWVLIVLLTMRCLGESLMCMLMASRDGPMLQASDVELLFVLVLFEDGQGLFLALLFGTPPGLCLALRSTWERLASTVAVQRCCCVDDPASARERGNFDESLVLADASAGLSSARLPAHL
eukprot:6772384-Prymnesium_polylepis.2